VGMRDISYQPSAVSHQPIPREVWGAGWATAGAAVWAAIALLARLGIVRVGAIELLFLFGPLVIVPLGMELGRVSEGHGRLAELARILQPLGAGCAVVAIWLPPGWRAAVAASGWMVVCAIVALAGVIRLMSAWGGVENRRGEAPVATRVGTIAAGIACIDLAVGGGWLVASRLGLRLMGIQEPIGLLTAVHFHSAGFATAMIAAATLRFAELRGESPWLRRVVIALVLLPFLVAAGFVVSPVLKMAAGVAFSGCVVGLAGFVWMLSGRVEQGTARGMLRLAASAVFVSMALSGAYAVADFLGSDLLPIPRMASTHGVLNAVGFCLLGLLGWVVEGSAKAFTTEGTGVRRGNLQGSVE
jgi:hypothetical protein